MSKNRFVVLPDNPLCVRDYHRKVNLHTGSMIEAVELCELLNSQQNKIEALQNFASTRELITSEYHTYLKDLLEIAPRRYEYTEMLTKVEEFIEAREKHNG